MPVAKGLPERPKAKKFQTTAEYLRAMESYTAALENWIDVECFNTGADETTPEEPPKTAEEIEKEKARVIKEILTTFCLVNEKAVKDWIVKKWPHGIGLYE
jgi:hypothetical protein